MDRQAPETKARTEVLAWSYMEPTKGFEPLTPALRVPLSAVQRGCLGVSQAQSRHRHNQSGTVRDSLKHSHRCMEWREDGTKVAKNPERGHGVT